MELSRPYKPVPTVLRYDPTRRMPNGETVYEARNRLFRFNRELRSLAMGRVKALLRVGMTISEAENHVYVSEFGSDKFPVVGDAQLKPMAPKLSEFLGQV